MDLHPFDILPLDQGGSLIFTPCPGTKGIDLPTSIDQLKQAGAKAVITLMPNEEMTRFGVETLPEACEQHGLKWFHLPIEDDTAPAAEFQQAWAGHKQQVNSILDKNGTVAIHCKGGSGRTGLMAAIILLERGIDFDQVVSMVKSLRPRSLKLQSHIDYLVRTYDSKQQRSF